MESEESTNCLKVHRTEERSLSVRKKTSTRKHGKSVPREDVISELPQYHTAPPWQLLRDDLILFLLKARLLPLLVFPLWYLPRRGADYPRLDKRWVPEFMASTTILNIVDNLQAKFQRFVDPHYPSGELDELYPSVGNITCLAAHTVLIVTQLLFIGSLPLLAFFPFHMFVPAFIGFLIVNHLACIPLNAGCAGGILRSNVPDLEVKHDDEEWLFLNGVSVGTHWLQGNLDRLARTFHRPIVGAHNETAGIVFDTIQCLIERCFYYGTSDTRNCYGIIAGALSSPQKKRVVLILHSQGGLQGSLILDWLLSHSSRADLKKLEIYTFGNAANHFSNPKGEDGKGVVNHIEHFTNSGDFVARWGATHFKDMVHKQQAQSRRQGQRGSTPSLIDAALGFSERQYSFHGHLFELKGKWGHLLNQHYLDRILPLNKTLDGVEEGKREGPFLAKWSDEDRRMGRLLSKADQRTIMDESRLWKYINGRKPKNDVQLTNGDH